MSPRQSPLTTQPAPQPEPTTQGEVWLTPRQVADRLSVSPRTVERWVAHDGLPAFQLGGRTTRISLSDLDAWVRSRPSYRAPLVPVRRRVAR